MAHAPEFTKRSPTPSQDTPLTISPFWRSFSNGEEIVRKILIHCNYICTTGVIIIPTTNLASLGPAALQVQVAQCWQKLEGKLPEQSS